MAIHLMQLSQFKKTDPALLIKARQTISSGAGLQNNSRKGYQRYKGPYLDQLSKTDLQTPPVQWSLALYGGDKAHCTHAYNVPEHAAMLQERLEENLVRYRVIGPACLLPNVGDRVRQAALKTVCH